jgi:hypothetical protein
MRLNLFKSIAMKLLKKSVYILMALLVTLMGCEEDKSSEGLSRLTYYPDFVFNGDEVVFVAKDAEFNEPGVTATEKGNSIPVTTSASGLYFGETALDTSSPDIYDVTYSATNTDGFAGTQSRRVIVAGQGDLVNSIEGLYTSTVVRNGVAAAQYTDMPYVIIRKTDADTYELSDGIGGYYDLGRAYGTLYAAQPATVTANDIATNDFTFGPAFGVGAFGGAAEITSMSVDPIAKTVKFTTEWDGGYTFVVTLKQVEF